MPALPAVAAAAAAARAKYQAQAEAAVAAGVMRSVGWGPVYVAKSRSLRVRPFQVYVPQADARFVGCVPTGRYATQEEAQAAADALLAANSYVLDAAGWWRPASA